MSVKILIIGGLVVIGLVVIGLLVWGIQALLDRE